MLRYFQCCWKTCSVASIARHTQVPHTHWLILKIMSKWNLPIWCFQVSRPPVLMQLICRVTSCDEIVVGLGWGGHYNSSGHLVSCAKLQLGRVKSCQLILKTINANKKYIMHVTWSMHIRVFGNRKSNLRAMIYNEFFARRKFGYWMCVLILMAYFTVLRGVGNISSEYRLVSIRWCNDSMMWVLVWKSFSGKKKS